MPAPPLRAALAALALPRAGGAWGNGVALTPPMGWNSWNAFHGGVTQAKMQQAADLLVSTGLRAKGYVYLNVDDGWAAQSRDAAGRLQPAAGWNVSALAAYAHARGLRFGVYSDAGYETCMHRAGSMGHERADAALFAGWGADLLKYDSCFTGGPSSQPADPPACEQAYRVMARALNETGRPMVYSVKGPCGRPKGLCSHPQSAAGYSNLRRAAGDIGDSWASVMKVLDSAAAVANYSSGPGFFNDLDILEVGNGGLSHVEEVAHFTLWAALKSPLLLGTDLRAATPAVLDIVSNEEVIAVSQDPLAVSARRVAQGGGASGWEAWAGPLSGGAAVAVLLNRGEAARNVTVTWAEAGLPRGPRRVRDLWARGGAAVVAAAAVTRAVAPHGVVALRLDPAQN